MSMAAEKTFRIMLLPLVLKLIMIVKLIEHGLVVIPTGSIMIKGSIPLYWILSKKPTCCGLGLGLS